MRLSRRGAAASPCTSRRGPGRRRPRRRQERLARSARGRTPRRRRAGGSPTLPALRRALRMRTWTRSDPRAPRRRLRPLRHPPARPRGSRRGSDRSPTNRTFRANVPRPSGWAAGRAARRAASRRPCAPSAHRFVGARRRETTWAPERIGERGHVPDVRVLHHDAGGENVATHFEPEAGPLGEEDPVAVVDPVGVLAADAHLGDRDELPIADGDGLRRGRSDLRRCTRGPCAGEEPTYHGRARHASDANTGFGAARGPARRGSRARSDLGPRSRDRAARRGACR